MNLKKDNFLLFVDILLINKNDELEFKVHHKNSDIHYFSNHSNKIKRGILIGFFSKEKPNLKNLLSQRLKKWI